MVIDDTTDCLSFTYKYQLIVEICDYNVFFASN